MGILLTRFRRQKDTYNILDDIDKELKSLQRFNHINQERRKKIIWRLVLYSILVYIICAFSLFFYMPDEWGHRVYGVIPFLCFPLLIYVLKRFLHWYFVRKITQNELKMQDLRSQRKEILENVMETETYKKAKEILEKFDPETKRKMEQEQKLKEEAELIAANPGLRQRNQNQQPNSNANTPQLPSPQNLAASAGPMIRNTPRMATSMLPRPILAPTPSTVDKVLNYLVGDGVEQRYALICKNCYNHNGMAMKGEFEYLAYRCAYCRFFNPARKQRPNAPRLPDVMPSLRVDSPTKDLSGDEGQGESLQSTPSTSRSTDESGENHHSDPKKLQFPTTDDGEITIVDESDKDEETANDESSESVLANEETSPNMEVDS